MNNNDDDGNDDDDDDDDNEDDDEDGNENVIKATGALRLRSQGTGRTFFRLKNLTGHSVHKEPFHIFALFTRNFKRLRV